jgi:hypothetical protein
VLHCVTRTQWRAMQQRHEELPCPARCRAEEAVCGGEGGPGEHDRPAVFGCAGVYKGPPASIDAAQVRAMKAQGKGASEIAKALKAVYLVLEAG